MSSRKVSHSEEVLHGPLLSPGSIELPGEGVNVMNGYISSFSSNNS